ncbi:hypothetical protein [Sunxiuqinia rutila]|uniref:hypothetical protein n=1 Tax=Sunxiuqinia rutila TaxID=1397841 RepID=UPI003D362A0F
MRKLVPLLMTLFFVVALTTASSAQGFLNKLSKKVQDKIEKKVDDKVDQKVDESLDEVFEEAANDSDAQNSVDKQNARLEQLMKGMGMSGDPVPIADTYAFDSKIQMHFESYKKNGKKDSEGEFITYVDPKSKNFAYEFIGGDMDERGQGTFIMDFENKAMIILAEGDGEKNGIVYGINDQNQAGTLPEGGEYPDLEDVETTDWAMNPYVKKTGKTKTIQGYRCEEYLYDNPEDHTKASFWVSDDVEIVTRDFMSAMLQAATYSYGMPGGCVMESESENTQTGERSIMRVTDIDTNANKQFSMSGYKITNLGSMKMPVMESE